MSVKLTEGLIERLHCPSGRRDRLVFDTQQRGLAVRVTAGGSTSYLVQYTQDGRKFRCAVGSTGKVSLRTARDAALVILAERAKGAHPAEDARKKKEAARAEAALPRITLGRMVEEWQRVHLSQRSGAYHTEAPRLLRRALSDLWDCPAERLTDQDLLEIIDESSHSIARGLKAYGSACASWAIKRKLIAVNPFSALPISMSTLERDRVLSDAELVRVWTASLAMLFPYGPAVRFLILTAQRRGEVSGLEWTELSDDLTTWTVPANRTKNGKAAIVALCRPARDIIEAMPRRRRGLVFAGEDGRRFGNWSRAKYILDERSGVVSWRLHDLRRTAATGLQRLGVRMEVTEAVLNHVAGGLKGVAAIYQRHDWRDEKAEALEAWAAHVDALVRPGARASRAGESDKVVIGIARASIAGTTPVKMPRR